MKPGYQLSNMSDLRIQQLVTKYYKTCISYFLIVLIGPLSWIILHLVKYFGNLGVESFNLGILYGIFVIPCCAVTLECVYLRTVMNNMITITTASLQQIATPHQRKKIEELLLRLNFFKTVLLSSTFSNALMVGFISGSVLVFHILPFTFVVSIFLCLFLTIFPINILHLISMKAESNDVENNNSKMLNSLFESTIAHSILRRNSKVQPNVAKTSSSPK